MTARDPVEVWIVDDTGFLKQGIHSVGVQRQYTGSAGKIANCQVGTSLTVATRTEQIPIDFALYLPKCWLDDDERREEARIPWDVQFATKPELGLQLIRRALDDHVPPGIVLADRAYGASEDFRDGIRDMGLHYAVAIDPKTRSWFTTSVGAVATRESASSNSRSASNHAVGSGERLGGMEPEDRRAGIVRRP